MLRPPPLPVSIALIVLGVLIAVASGLTSLILIGNFHAQAANITVPTTEPIRIEVEPNATIVIAREHAGPHITLNRPHLPLPADLSVTVLDAATNQPIETLPNDWRHSQQLFGLRRDRRAILQFQAPRPTPTPPPPSSSTSAARSTTARSSPSAPPSNSSSNATSSPSRPAWASAARSSSSASSPASSKPPKPPASPPESTRQPDPPNAHDEIVGFPARPTPANLSPMRTPTPVAELPAVTIGTTPDRGRAVFAARDFAKGELVDTAPVILGDTHWDDLPDWIGHYVYSWLEIGGRDAIVAVALGHGSLYNASTTANLSFRAAKSNDAIEYHAARDIRAGEELTINYSSDHGDPTSDDNSWFTDRDIPYRET